MLELKHLIASVDSDEKKIRLLFTALPAGKYLQGHEHDDLTLAGVLLALLFDFLLVIGKPIEDALPIVLALEPRVANYAKRLEKDLAADTPRVLPAFMSLIDNRFVNFSYGAADTTVYDSLEGVWINALQVPPVCSLSVSLPAMYLSSVAAYTSHQRFAHAFKAGRIQLPGMKGVD